MSCGHDLPANFRVVWVNTANINWPSFLHLLKIVCIIGLWLLFFTRMLKLKTSVVAHFFLPLYLWDTYHLWAEFFLPSPTYPKIARRAGTHFKDAPSTHLERRQQICASNRYNRTSHQTWSSKLFSFLTLFLLEKESLVKHHGCRVHKDEFRATDYVSK